MTIVNKPLQYSFENGRISVSEECAGESLLTKEKDDCQYKQDWWRRITDLDLWKRNVKTSWQLIRDVC